MDGEMDEWIHLLGLSLMCSRAEKPRDVEWETEREGEDRPFQIRQFWKERARAREGEREGREEYG